MMDRKDRVSRQNRSRGTVIALFLVLSVPVFVLFLSLLWFNLLEAERQRDLNAAEAASLAVAGDLSRIVVNDPYYGFVALSDYGPYGKETSAADGEPLPVLGINSIIAMARLQILIADELDNDQLRKLAQEDVQAAMRAAKLLSDALNASINPNSGYKARDLDGNPVRPFDHALQTYLTNLRNTPAFGKAEVSDFHLSLGWLKGGSNSNAKAPLPENLSQMTASGRLKGNYRAFVDIPACGQSFYLAGLSEQASLVDTRDFMAPDGKRLCSIVKVEANLVVPGLYNQKSPQRLRIAACAQPPGLADRSTPGLLALNFRHGLVPGISCIQNILDNPQLNENTVELLTADGGDFPIDSHSRLVPAPDGESVMTISQTFATGFHDWLRTAHNKPRLDSVLEMVSMPFSEMTQTGSGFRRCPNLIYEFDSEGRIRVNNMRQCPFYTTDTDSYLTPKPGSKNKRLRLCTYDHQNYGFGYEAIVTGGYSWIMVYRNYVHVLGTASGGKHAGQVLAGDPVNWCELPQYDSSPGQAFEKGKGEKALGLQVQGQTYDGSGVMLEGSSFTKQNGDPLSHQPRRSNYSGGLAVYFELSSPLRQAPVVN